MKSTLNLHRRYAETPHVAIIMDGNGRWAERRGLPREEGHRAGAFAVKRSISAAVAHDVPLLTLYAFSSDNWRRPKREVSHLMRLFQLHLRSEGARCEKDGIRVKVMGRRDRLSPALVREIEAIEARTRDGRALGLQIAVDYSSLDGLVTAAAELRNRRESLLPLDRSTFRSALHRAVHAPPDLPDVDLLLRTGGEQRLSDFLLWECAYAEMVFAPVLWPDFAESDFVEALQQLASRNRRFGAVAAREMGGVA
jgi:undecaprenyl diphosphate synthase